jgi:signal transduction histidine kinase
MTSTHKPSISRELARRLFPLALALGFLLSVFMPGLYCLFEYKKVEGEAGAYARQLAEKIKPLVATSPDLWKYQATKYSYIINSFIPGTGISSIAILDEVSHPINQYNHTSSSDDIFGPLEIRGRPAPIIFNNHRIGEIHIGRSADRFLLISCLVFLACLLTGLPLSLLIYKIPLNIVTKLEAQLIDYQRTLEEKSKLEELNRQLQKTESLHRMAGAIAHHFNNQLGVVIGNLELALDDMPREAETIEPLSEAMQGALKAAEVSGLMLTYLGQTTGKHTEVDLVQLCRRSLPLLQAAAPKGVIFKVDLPSPGPILHGNSNQIQQILTNLMSNGWEAIGSGRGTIGLTVRTVAPAEIPTVHRLPIDWQVRNALHACLEISDSGCGIDEKDIEKIFDPFYSTKFTGRGLGLPVVLGIVKVHGGGITLESQAGAGSTFRVYFPEVVAPRRSEAVYAEPAARPGGGTVLLVEDDEMMRNMVATMLGRLGFTVLPAGDGRQALQMFQQCPQDISVVLCDLSMPHMDGWETLAALRRIRPNIPVILASGYDEAQVISGDHPELPQAFLHKPYRKSLLEEALAKALVR